MSDMLGEWGNMKAISNHDSLQSVDYPVLNNMDLKYYTFYQTA